MHPSGPEHRWPIARTLGASLAFTIFWATGCNLLLELLQQASLEVLVGDALGSTLLNTTLVWVLLALLIALTGRLWPSAALLLGLTMAIGYSNRLKLRLRREPLFPSDLTFGQHLGFLNSVVGGRTTCLLLALVSLSLITVMLVGRMLRLRFPRWRPQTHKTQLLLLGCRAMTVALCLTAFVYAAHFNSSHNRLRHAYEADGVVWLAWDQSRNYLRNGFVAGLLYNTDVRAMPKPSGYDGPAMAAISDKYTRIAAKENRTRDAHALDDVNVVMVLSESMSDPTRLQGLHLSKDPIPFTRGLMRENVSGTMLAQGYGGGTANMEFEALTGMSLRLFSPNMQIPYQMLVSNFASFPSAVGYFSLHDHEAVAVHPYDTYMYKRTSVYRTFGFKRFVSAATMQSQKKQPGSDYISDASAFDEVEHQIDSSAKPVFLNLVTMQNHNPWKAVANEPIHVTGVEGDQRLTAQAYARGLLQSDDALRDFTQQLATSDEKTVVLLYGDHLPGLWPDKVQRANGELRMHETPFVLWSNFKKFPHRDVKLTSPTHFMPLIFDAIGAPVPPYYAMLDSLAHEVPAMDGGLMLDPDGSSLSVDDLSIRAREVLHDYRLVQYDLSVGHRYSLNPMFYGSEEAVPGVSAAP